MDEINSIIQLAAQTLLDKYGDDFRLEEGDSKVFTLNNGTLVLSIDNGELDVQLDKWRANQVGRYILNV